MKNIKINHKKPEKCRETGNMIMFNQGERRSGRFSPFKAASPAVLALLMAVSAHAADPAAPPAASATLCGAPANATQTLCMPKSSAFSLVSFAFGAGTVGTKVADDTAYDAARGYGFVSTPGGNEKAFSVKVPAGDYLVTVTLGDKKAASRTSVWAEERRLVAAPVVLKKGETKTLSFRVNVRDDKLTPDVQDGVPYTTVRLRTDDIGSRSWDDQLTIAVSGEAPAWTGLTVTPVSGRRILLAGDSTVTDQSGGDYASWGQMLPRFIAGDVTVANHARSGATMKEFLTSMRWDKLMSETRPGDIVLIQFGHNDEKKQWPHTYAAADSGYPAFLGALVADVRQHGASPVIISPVQRLGFGPDGKIRNSHQGYDEAVRKLGVQLNVPVIDLTTLTAQMYEALGPANAPLAFANHGQEKTHHAAYGAYMIACIVTQHLVAMPELGVKAATDTPACTPDKPLDPKNYEIQPGDWPIMRVKANQGAEVAPAK
jgi:lysophospholipase L1-like esterase